MNPDEPSAIPAILARVLLDSGARLDDEGACVLALMARYYATQMIDEHIDEARKLAMEGAGK